MGKTQHNFQKLTPASDVELGIYKDALDFAFENDDLRNIAISGPYCAGKSSLLKTYKKEKTELNCIHISLAHFECSEKPQGNEQNRNFLEGKILNQLIHQIPSKHIQDTNFRIKKSVGWEKPAWLAFLLTFFLVSLLSFKFSFLPSNYWLKILVGLLSTAIFGYFAFLLIHWFRKIQLLKKISLKGIEFEIFEDSKDSYFDKYLNEILYLFENSQADVIIFEDLDRYEVVQIFERLKEINLLINNHILNSNNKEEKSRIIRFVYQIFERLKIYTPKNKKEHIKFVYLLRDDIFSSKERTKFFDYIIPVIPVVDSSNAYDTFIDLFSTANLLKIFDKNFLQDVSLYIDDMRVLKNIANEFLIYKEKLDSIELNKNKLLAIIIYKNIFPKDYSLLQLDKGFVHTLFSRKEHLVSEQVKQHEKEITNLEKKLGQAAHEHVKNLKELEMIYSHEINSSPYGSNVKEDTILKEKNTRQEALGNKDKKKQDELTTEISALKKELALLHSKKLHSLLTRENSNDFFKVTHTNEIEKETTFHEIKGSDYFPLLKYLIRSGFIDETYSDYMSYFYEHSLSRHDKIFLRSVTDKQAKEPSYPLNDAGLVISRLQTKDFKQQEILNFDIVSSY